MAIYYDENVKKWYFKVKYTNEFGITKYTTRRGYQTKKEAKLAEHEFLTAGYRKVTSKKGKLTFRELYEEYYEFNRTTMKDASLITLDNKIRNHVFPYFEDAVIENITIEHIRLWQLKMLNHEKHYSIVYLQGIFSKFSTIMGYAVKYCYIEKNVCSIHGNFKKTVDDHKKFNYYTYEEWLQFESTLPEDIYKLFFELLYWTGVRLGEALALTFRDLNMDCSAISINNSVTSKSFSHGPKVTSVKTESSIRTISLPSQLSGKLMKYIQYCKENNLYREDAFIFGINKPLSSTTIERRKNKACDTAGLKRIRIHDFRHSHASLLINEGVKPIEVSKRLGHSSVSTTLDVYTHFFQKKEDSVLQVLNNLAV